MAQFADLFAIVTGAGGGIGRAITRALLNNGATVWAAGRTESTLTETVLGFGSRGRAHPTDLTEDADVDRIASDAEREFGGLDILVAGRMRDPDASDSW